MPLFKITHSFRSYLKKGKVSFCIDPASQPLALAF
jgi:hypothetical protein